MPLAMMMIYRTFISHICAFSLQIFLLPVPTHPGTQIFLQVQNPSHPEVKNPCPTGPAHEYHNKKKNMRTSPLPITILELILHNRYLSLPQAIQIQLDLCGDLAVLFRTFQIQNLEIFLEGQPHILPLTGFMITDPSRTSSTMRILGYEIKKGLRVV